jgi:hypothetical protein
METVEENNRLIECLDHAITVTLGLTMTFLITGLIVMLSSDTSYATSLSVSFEQYKHTYLFLFFVLFPLSYKIDRMFHIPKHVIDTYKLSD